MTEQKRINVTKTFLPSLEEYSAQIKRAFDNEWLTNRGELVLELEAKLKDYLEIDNILITNNGTIPIQIALKLLGGKGEIITTPFSYVATTSAIVWEGCTPVFVDIHPEYLTIDASKIEAAITERTTCILATHVFGNPCEIEAIEEIAIKHKLKVIYDAAHCFGVKYKGKSIFSYGDVSTCSFHATKLFHTGEGGAIFCNDPELRHKIYYSHNFGHNGPEDFYGVGINGKISELQAAMGLAVLPHLNEIIANRSKVTEIYQSSLDLSKVCALAISGFTTWNYSYFPVLFQNEQVLLECLKLLNANSIFPRRYFYPSLSKLPYVGHNEMSIAEDIASRVLCLPLSHDLTAKEANTIVNLINQAVQGLY
ncbi:MAG: DegT/DnrJ/EryC1/StrS family aminotransferase [Bacteroidia bacterium]